VRWVSSVLDHVQDPDENGENRNLDTHGNKHDEELHPSVISPRQFVTAAGQGAQEVLLVDKVK